MALAGFAFSLGACGGPSTSDQERSAETGSPESPKAAVSGGKIVIRMTDDMRFVPPHPVISAGDTVVWINEGSIPHTATDAPGRAAVPEHNVLPHNAEPWDSGTLASGQRFEQVLTVGGEYTYVCVLHETGGMIGRLTVE